MTTPDYFLVCGLGSLGQQCVVALKAFGVRVVAIERQAMETYDIPSVPHQLDQLIIGDCSYSPVLETLGLKNCRAALLVTSQDQVNIETALLIRQLNPETRLVVRSGQNNLNELLSEQLGNFVAYEPLDLPANAFALAALGSNTLGFFELNHQNLRVTRTLITPDHPWSRNKKLHELNAHNRRILSVQEEGTHSSFAFHQWDGERSLAVGESVIYVESVDNFDLTVQSFAMGKKMNSMMSTAEEKKQRFPLIYLDKWQQVKSGLQSRPIILFSGMVILGLLVLGTILLYITLPDIDLLGALYRTVVLLLGGYGDLLADIHSAKQYRWLLEPLALSLTLSGIAFVGILYASLTESLLASKFNFARKRLPIPKQSHIVILGLGRVGQRVARLLKNWKQPIVGITLKSDFDPLILSDIPVLTQTLEEGFPKANLAVANSVVVVTDDDMLNLEVALITQKINPQAHLIIRTAKEGLAHSLMSLLPQAQILETYRLAAEVFVGSAFGENILNLFRLHHETILVTEYEVEIDDTLVGLLLAEVAYGYSVVPLLYQSSLQSALLFPSDDIVLRVGDRLIILATIEGLRKIEVRALQPKTWRIQIERVLNKDSAFEGANIVSRISGCSLQQTRKLMEQIPQTLSTPLYRPQAQRLIRALRKTQISASLLTTQGNSR